MDDKTFYRWQSLTEEERAWIGPYIDAKVTDALNKAKGYATQAQQAQAQSINKMIKELELD